MSQRLSPLSVLIAFGLAVGPITVRAGDWQDYARAAMTPDFQWAQADAVAAPDVRQGSGNALEQSVRAEFQLALTRQSVSFQFHEARADDAGIGQVAQLSLIDSAQPGLARQFAAAQLAHRFDGGAQVSAGVVVAEQQFASFGFGSEAIETHDRLRLLGNESATAAGVRLTYAQPMGERVSLSASTQSKINMQPFQSYRGVFSDPGDFDIPAEAAISARVALSPTVGVTVGSREVLYSGLKAFSSYALPERFLSLLGDGTSPEFAWRDLTVYNLALDWAVAKSTRLDVRYSTQQQPEPTSALLFDALSDEFTDRNMAVGLTHQFKRLGEVRMAASYAPVEYFLGTTSALGRSDARGDQFEFEARWRLDF